ncbi:MAG: hypothetical protein ACT4PT_11735 [Methanobacteriota archaeon]
MVPMTRRIMTWILLGGVLALSGCLGGDDDGDTPPAGGTATSITVTAAPSDAQADSRATVCWRIEGSGQVPHTAVHYGDESRPQATSFQDYPNAAYPENRTAADPAGYDLPGTFCTGVPVGEQDVYLRAHVIDSEGGNGRLSEESRIRATGGTPAAAVVSVSWDPLPPASGNASAPVVLCWSVAGAGTIPHTAVHSDAASHANDTGIGNYRAAHYPENASSAQPKQLPGRFCTSVTLPASGTLYVRAHAMITPPGTVSEERAIAVTPASGNQTNGTNATGVILTQTWSGTVPTSAQAGSNVTVCWDLTGTGRVAHTGIHWDNVTHASELRNITVYNGTPPSWPGNATVADPAGYEVPGHFCSNVRVSPTIGETRYFRLHSIDSAGHKVGLDEKAILATA